VQELVETQDTPLSSLNGTEAVLGLGLGTADQVVPSQISMRVMIGCGTKASAPFEPTAMQNVVETHETPLRSLPGKGALLGFGFALGTMDQLVPFQTSISVSSVARVLPLGNNTLPTAVQEFVEMQETPEKREVSGAKLTVGTTDQVVPSQLSVSVEVTRGEPLSWPPTVMHRLVVGQETAANPSPTVLGLGLATTDQVVPSTPPVSMRV
jgi:hypothetical protein